MSYKKFLYIIKKENHDFENLQKLLEEHKNIKFVSLLAFDLKGHGTSELIPIKHLYDILSQGIQTDGSSVVLHGIATLDNAKVNIIPDIEVDWFVEYNYEHLDSELGLPVGTLKIPSILVHNGIEVCSRSILKRAKIVFKKELLKLLNISSQLGELGLENTNCIEDILLTTATELEFWVKTPEEKSDIKNLSTSQHLKEQYWKKTRGVVRTALEKVILLMESYGLNPEMGHKEVGGVRGTINTSGQYSHVMEQLEIDWHYTDALQAMDNDVIVRDLIIEVFQSHGLEVTFKAKPIEGVAGSGKHTHLGVALKLKNGKIINLFSIKDNPDEFLSSFGYGALMGMLKNYEVINPIVAPTTDALNRLKPGFEAPVCIVTSLGKSPLLPSRNRSVLIGLVKENNPLSTRFELRSPSPLTNTYLVVAASYQAMLDGISYVIKSKKTVSDLRLELSKDYGDQADYLEAGRCYRSEKNVFEYYNEIERNKLFGIPPRTVIENINNFSKYPEKKKILLENQVFTQELIQSYVLGVIEQWQEELKNRVLEVYRDELRLMTKCHDDDSDNEIDNIAWSEIEKIKYSLLKSTSKEKSLFSKLKQGLAEGNIDLSSKLQIEIVKKIEEIRILYHNYRQNLINGN